MGRLVPEPRTEALILIGLGIQSFFKKSSEHNTAAALPSPMGAHMGTVNGQLTMRACQNLVNAHFLPDTGRSGSWNAVIMVFGSDHRQLALRGPVLIHVKPGKSRIDIHKRAPIFSGTLCVISNGNLHLECGC